ncbi:MAG: hypothetical protein IT581_20270 [Verrucomicrobiales bacterium]|nr:hypothetical protein [Verrucomicrobiales bacterium]
MPANGASGKVRFEATEGVDRCLWGREIKELRPSLLEGIKPHSGDAIMATRQGHPVWTRRLVDGRPVMTVAQPVRDLVHGEFLHQRFSSESFLPLLPWIAFARHVGGPAEWRRPGIGACFVWDDPNLKRARYGYLVLRKLAKHAREHGYHTALAMIPMDMEHASPEAVGVVKEFGDALSLLIHGNDHLDHELGSRLPLAEAQSMLAQALARTARFERRFGVEVPRVMEAPHGLYDAEMLQCLSEAGFNAALITPVHLTSHNTSVGWPLDVGLRSCDCLPGGLGFIPRIRMSSSWSAEALLAVYLDQPVLIAGHHQDAARGLDFLRELSELLRGVPGLRWDSVGGLARMNYLQRTAGTRLEVRAFSRWIDVVVPEGAEEVKLEPSWECAGGPVPLRFRRQSETEWTQVVMEPRGSSGHEAVVKVAGARRIEFHCPSRPHPGTASIPERSSRLWPLIRRRMTEARDRSRPWWGALARDH